MGGVSPACNDACAIVDRNGYEFMTAFLISQVVHKTIESHQVLLLHQMQFPGIIILELCALVCVFDHRISGELHDRLGKCMGGSLTMIVYK